MTAPVEEQLRIEQLAQRAGMTVRNIRAHQSRGLLPPPEVRARTGYYGQEHLARIRLIKELQAEGFNLKAIQRLVEATDGPSRELLELRRAMLASFSEEEPEIATMEELEERLGGPIGAGETKEAHKIGLVRPLPDGRFEIPSPTLLRAGEKLVSLGIPLSHALAVAEQVVRHSRAIAESFVRLFVEDVVGDSLDAGDRSGAEWARLRSAFEQLSPLATEAVRAGFQQTMSGAVERQLEKTLPG